MKRVVIVDDSPEDRRSLLRQVRKHVPDVEVAEAASVSEMYACLAQPCELLFQDVVLEPRDGVNDSHGLTAIYDVVDSYPGLPVVVVTGHLPEKAGEVIASACDCRTVVGFLDKAEYDAATVAEVLEKARAFRESWAYEQEKVDFVEEVFAEAERKVEELKRQYEQERANESDKAHLYRKALTGNDWIRRARSEVELNGHCTLNVLALCRVIERRVRDLFRGSSQDNPTFYKKIRWIQERYGLSSDEFRQINYAWRARNEIVHAKRHASIGDAKQLTAALETLDAASA